MAAKLTWQQVVARAWLVLGVSVVLGVLAAVVVAYWWVVLKVVVLGACMLLVFAILLLTAWAIDNM